MKRVANGRPSDPAKTAHGLATKYGIPDHVRILWVSTWECLHELVGEEPSVLDEHRALRSMEAFARQIMTGCPAQHFEYDLDFVSRQLGNRLQEMIEGEKLVVPVRYVLLRNAIMRGKEKQSRYNATIGGLERQGLSAEANAERKAVGR